MLMASTYPDHRPQGHTRDYSCRMTTDVAVREAVQDDAAGIARVHLQAWRESYAHLLPAAALAGLQQGPREAKWRDIITTSGSNVWVACAGTDIIGWASAGPDAMITHPAPGS